jgi:hypothetical protein
MPIDDSSYKRLNAKNVNRSPKKRGVYALYAEGRLVFLGQAAGKEDTIRSRLRVHLGKGGAKETRYKREATRSPAARLRELLDEYVRAHGRLPSLNAEAL